MSALTIADINVAVDHEPRIMDLRLAEALGFDDKRGVRRLADRHMEALERFGEVSVTVTETSEKGGRPGRTYWLNLRQALYLATKSEAENAVDLTVEMVDLFASVREGRFVEANAQALPAPSRPGIAVMRIGGKIVTVDTRMFQVNEDVRVVRVHHNGSIDIGTVRETAMNWMGARGYYSSWRKPRAGDAQKAEKISDIVQVLGVVIDEAKPDRQQIPAPTKRRPGKFEPGSDTLRDLCNVVRSAMCRTKADPALGFDRALHETLEDIATRRRNPGAAVRGAAFDYDEGRARDEMIAIAAAKGWPVKEGARPLNRTAEFESRAAH